MQPGIFAQFEIQIVGFCLRQDASPWNEVDAAAF